MAFSIRSISIGQARQASVAIVAASVTADDVAVGAHGTDKTSLDGRVGEERVSAGSPHRSSKYVRKVTASPATQHCFVQDDPFRYAGGHSLLVIPQMVVTVTVAMTVKVKVVSQIMMFLIVLLSSWLLSWSEEGSRLIDLRGRWTDRIDETQTTDDAWTKGTDGCSLGRLRDGLGRSAAEPLRPN